MKGKTPNMLIVHMYHMQHTSSEVSWLGGATVARLTPDQKVACSNHVRVINIFIFKKEKKTPS